MGSQAKTSVEPVPSSGAGGRVTGTALSLS